MITPEGCTEISLSVFGGENTELDPTDLPAGLSYSCPDVAFAPGRVFTRPPLAQLDTLGTTAQIVYAASFVKPDGTVVQLRFDSLGGMWADGKKIGATQPGNRFVVENVFGKAYIAISDGLHGADVPLQFDGTNLDRVSQDGPAAAPNVSNFGLPQVQLTSLTRTANTVTAVTAIPSGVLQGYQVNVEGVANASTDLTSIVIDNNVSANIATVTTNVPHNFVPDDLVTLIGVQAAIVGSGLASYTTTTGGGRTTITTNTAHRLRTGDLVVVTLGANGIPIQFAVNTVVSDTVFTILNPQDDDKGSTGSVLVPWVPDSGTEFSIVAVPSPTTFQIAVTQGNGTWTTGEITFPWDGSFYVSNVLSPTSFTYVQAGPNDSIQGGTLTPNGQIAAGTRKCRWVFQTRSGSVSAPGPASTFTASGGEYLQVTDAPIGPDNVVARILICTAANGANYFYLPVPAIIGGEMQGTAMVIKDNVTTSAVFDFSDQALLNSTGVGPTGTAGANLFNQEVLESALGFYSYAERLFAWGERNVVQGLYNMGFEGGVSSTAPTLPLGWSLGFQGGGGKLVPGDYGMGWQVTGGGTGTDGVLFQPAFQDEFGDAILQPSTQYLFRCYARGTGTAVLSLYSSSATNPVIAQAYIPITAAGGFAQVQFTAKTPAVIPADAQIQVLVQGLASGQTAMLDELSIVYAQNPYRLTARASYVNNPEAFDGVTGILGAATDPQPIMGMRERDDTLCILTFGPKGSLYETEDSPSAEPANWNLRHKSSLCGLLSVWGVATFEDWFVWASDTGLRIFDGGGVDKISQEQQAWWDTINPIARQFTAVANDPNTRRIYIGACTTSVSTPNSWYVLDYRDLNSAEVLAGSGTLHVAGTTGRVVTTDLTRKWSPWSIQANNCSMLTLSSGASVMVFCGGYGDLTVQGHSATYTLEEGSLTGVDADYGPFWQNSSYATYFMLAPDDAIQRQLGPHRLLHTFMSLNVIGNGSVSITPYLNRTDNPAQSTRFVPVTPTLARDVEYGLNLGADRISYRISAEPVGPQPFAPGLPAGFSLSSLTVAVKPHPFSPIRGRNG